MVAFVEGYAKAAGTSVHREHDCVWAEPQIGFAAYGIVAKHRFETNGIDSRLETLRDKAIGGCWWVTPISQPGDLPQRLVGMGAEKAVQLTGMAVEFENLVHTTQLPEGIDIIRADTEELVEAYARTYPYLFTDNPGPWVEDVIRLNLASFRSVADPFHRWIAMEEGRAIAAGMTMQVGSLAVLQTLCTLKEHRNQGIGSVLLSRAMEAEKEAGCTLAGLWAGPGADKLYRKLGFQEIGLVDLYCF